MVLNEQTLFAICHPGVSCNPLGRVGSGIGMNNQTKKIMTIIRPFPVFIAD